jgi:hypothetical protein
VKTINKVAEIERSGVKCFNKDIKEYQKYSASQIFALEYEVNITSTANLQNESFHYISHLHDKFL